MALVTYTDVPTMRTYLNMVVTDFDDLLLESIESASREVDKRTRRYFGQDEEASTRRFRVEGCGLLAIDDVADPDSIEINGEPLSDAIEALPYNGVVDGVPGHPITRLRGWFREGSRVDVTAIWGWPEVPSVIREATKMLAAETFMQKDTPLGYKGSEQIGVVIMRERVPTLKKLELYRKDYYL